MEAVENVIIIGSGPAGYTAALYAARAELSPLVIEGFAWGGLLQQTTDVENFPGFPQGVMGPELMAWMREQAERFGARMVTEEATRVELAQEPGALHRVWIDEELHTTRSVILAMGAVHKKLDVPGEAELSGRGVSYCATCDAAFFKDRQTVIVGGGDSAMEEAMFLAKFSAKVTVVHRRDEFRASRIMLDRARAVPNIEFLTPYVVVELLPGEDGALGVARLRNTQTDEEREAAALGSVRGDRPRAPVRAGPRHDRRRRERLRDRRGALDPHQPPGRLRRRGPRRPHLSPGGHGRGLGLPGGARRGVVPARHAGGGGRRGDRQLLTALFVPEHYRQRDEPALFEAMRVNAFATIISAGADGAPAATWIPFLIEGTPQRPVIFGHMARANDQWRSWSARTPLLALFQGPHHYISPSWYEPAPHVPTWNYLAVQVRGRPRLLEDGAEVEAMLDRLVDAVRGAARDALGAWRPAGGLPLAPGGGHRRLRAADRADRRRLEAFPAGERG